MRLGCLVVKLMLRLKVNKFIECMNYLDHMLCMDKYVHKYLV